MARRAWEMESYAEMEAHLARARRLRSEAVGGWLVGAWDGLAWLLATAAARVDRAVHHHPAA